MNVETVEYEIPEVVKNMNSQELLTEYERSHRLELREQLSPAEYFWPGADYVSAGTYRREILNRLTDVRRG